MQEDLSVARRFLTSEVTHVEIYGRMGRLVTQMKNLSSTGAHLQLTNGEYIPKKGDLIKATVHLHTLGRSRSIDGEVVWHNGLGFGIVFLKKPQLLERMFQRTSASF